MWVPARFRTAAPDELVQVAQRLETDPPEVLAITSEDRMYYLLLSASIDLGWKIAWARTVGRAFELYRVRPRPLVIFDERLPGADWREALPGIGSLPHHPLILLAASKVNEEIWRTVLRCRGYDAVKRSAGSQEWARELRFAWRSKVAAKPLFDTSPG